jgi:hypothetical protein
MAIELFEMAPIAASSMGAHSGDRERSIRPIMNTDSGDHEHLLAVA